MNYICALYHKDYVSDGHDILIERHPTPAMHVGPNQLYAQTAESLDVPDDHEDLVVAYFDSGEINWPATEWWIAQRLVNPTRKPLHAPLSVWKDLTKRPTYRLYSGLYEEGEEELFRSDVDYVSTVIEAVGMTDALEQWKAATESITYEQSKDVMFALIGSFGRV